MMRGLLARLASLALCVAVLVNAEGSTPEELVVPEVLVQVKAAAKASHIPDIPFEEVLDGARKKDPVFSTQLVGRATPDPATHEILNEGLVQVEADAGNAKVNDPVFEGGYDPVFGEVMLEEEADAGKKKLLKEPPIPQKPKKKA